MNPTSTVPTIKFLGMEKRPTTIVPRLVGPSSRDKSPTRKTVVRLNYTQSIQQTKTFPTEPYTLEEANANFDCLLKSFLKEYNERELFWADNDFEYALWFHLSGLALDCTQNLPANTVTKYNLVGKLVEFHRDLSNCLDENPKPKSGRQNRYQRAFKALKQ